MKNDNIKIKYFVYPRKSSEQEDRQVASIDSQIRELGDMAKNDKLSIVATLEESHSAKHPGRPVFNKMVERIEKGEANGLLVWNASRISRNSIDTGKIIYLFDIGKLLEVRTPSQVFHNTPNDKFLLNLFCSQAKLENDNKGEDVKRGLRGRILAGVFPGRSPTGYMGDKYAERGTKKNRVDPERFDTVRRMFDLILTGSYTVVELYRIITKEWKFKTLKGVPIGKSTFYKIFSNPFYYGTFEYPLGSGNWVKGEYKPMITEEEYDQIQYLLGRKGRPRPKNHIFDFPGMIKCGECRGTVIVEEKWKHQKNGNVHHYVYYRCSKRITPNCSQGCLEIGEMNKQINKKIAELWIPPEFNIYALKWFRKENEKEAGSRNAVLKTQQAGYTLCLKKIDGYMDMRAAQLIGDDEYNAKIAPLKKEKAQLEELLGDTGERVNKWLSIGDEMLAFIKDAIDKFNNGTVPIRKGILSTLGQNLLLKDRILQIDLENSLFPMISISSEVSKIHKPLEPRKTQMKQEDYEALYDQNPLVQRHGESDPASMLEKHVS